MMNMDSARGGDGQIAPEGWKLKKSRPKYESSKDFSGEENDNPFPADWRVKQSEKNRKNGNDDPSDYADKEEKEDETQESSGNSKEKWKFVMGPYEISNMGRARRGDKILKPRISSRGFAYLHASYDGKVEQPSYHSLVLKAFGPPPPKGVKNPVIAHKNNNKKDNRISNLKWASTAENTSDAYDDGLIEGKGANNKKWRDKNGENGEKKKD